MAWPPREAAKDDLLRWRLAVAILADERDQTDRSRLPSVATSVYGFGMGGHRTMDEAWWTGADVGVRVGVLGPMRLDVEGVERPLTARRQRAVLACLVLHVGEAVSADRLLHDVWGDALPPDRA